MATRIHLVTLQSSYPTSQNYLEYQARAPWKNRVDKDFCSCYVGYSDWRHATHVLNVGKLTKHAGCICHGLVTQWAASSQMI